jgi:preprotein translocase subunit SecG
MLFFVIIIILLYVSTKRELNKGSENGKTSFKNLASNSLQAAVWMDSPSKA